MQSSPAFPLTQGTRINNALDFVEEEMAMLVDTDAPPLTQRSDRHRREIFNTAHAKLHDILALVPSQHLSQPPPQSPPTAQLQRQTDSPTPPSNNTNSQDPPPPNISTTPRWVAIMEATHTAINAEEFTRTTFNAPLRGGQTARNIEDDGLVRLIRGYHDDDADWAIALQDMKHPYQSHVLDMYSQLNAVESRDQIYREFLTAQHRHKIHTFIYHVVSFIKLYDLLEALACCEADGSRSRARLSYVDDVFPRRYKHLIDEAKHHATAPHVQDQLKKQLSALKRTFKKRFKDSLERADILVQLYQSFGAAVLLDPSWHFEWLEDVPPFSKGFRDILTYACANAPAINEHKIQSARALRHVMSSLGDEDANSIVDEWLNEHEPLPSSQA
ncbi:hypothetical protein BDZ89DRAFT_1140436 [Hymenopellis radicata]|nr:hypothetical protein BDZ89DRAFT_1140436 [Hymenopellis radicata]